jgi:hypothetical protein
MSRSYREPWFTCGYGGSYKRFAKRQANKHVRKASMVSNGMMYKKIHCSWDICDYKFYAGKEKDKWYEKARRK